jgi:hypothetical protein
MKSTRTSPSVATKPKTLNPVDYVARTPAYRLHSVEEFIDKLQDAVRIRL